MKLIVASNRLPITVSRDGDGFSYKKTSGGLVTGIEGLANHLDFIWIGNISGIDLDDKNKETINKDCWDKFKSVPVFISPELNDASYNGFCNAILWPTLHSFPDDVCFTYNEYEAYVEYNLQFAEKILETCADNDIIWIHDYHLMLVPEILRKRNATLKIMFFFHTAFPEHSNLCPLIFKKRLLRGVCACDVISFHLPDYALNFKEAIDAMHLDTSAILKAIPIGIDPEMFRTAVKDPVTISRMEELRERFKGKKIILGVDRTDYIKGMPQKLKGFQRFLERNPEMKDEIVLLQIGIPSRLDVKEYSSYVSKINELVTEINGCVGNIVNTPVHLLFNSVDFNELCALYAVADILLVTSIMDGMNLVALEYVACQDEREGIVVLSKFAGAYPTLQGSIAHNPNNTEEIAEALEGAIKQTAESRKERHTKNKDNIDLFTSVKWAEENLDTIYADWRKELTGKQE